MELRHTGQFLSVRLLQAWIGPFAPALPESQNPWILWAFSYIDNSFFTHRKLHLDNSCLSYVSDGFLPFLRRSTKSSTNVIPKRSKALACYICLNGVTFWHSNYRDNEEVSNSGCVVARHVSSENAKTRLDEFHLCCVSNVSMKQFYGRSANTLEMQHKLN